MKSFQIFSAAALLAVQAQACIRIYVDQTFDGVDGSGHAEAQIFDNGDFHQAMSVDISNFEWTATVEGGSGYTVSVAVEQQSDQFRRASGTVNGST